MRDASRTVAEPPRALDRHPASALADPGLLAISTGIRFSAGWSMSAVVTPSRLVAFPSFQLGITAIRLSSAHALARWYCPTSLTVPSHSQM